MLGNISESSGLRRALAAVVLGGTAAVANAQSTLSLPAQVGRQLFFDTNLSASKQMACSTCHDPSNHYAPSNALSVQLGGPKLATPGLDRKSVV